MGWERQKPFTTEQPSPPSSGGWLISGVLAVIAGVLLFVLHASGTFSALKAINIWLFALIPVVLWILTFSTCGYLYGREMERFQFFQREARTRSATMDRMGRTLYRALSKLRHAAGQYFSGIIKAKPQRVTTAARAGSPH